MTKAHHVVRNVGRLLEIRPGALQSVEAVRSVGTAIAQMMRKVAGELDGGVIVCADWRGMRVLAPDVAEALTALMRGGNPRVLRSAALIGGHATFGLQVERVIRAANSPVRRAFRDGEELVRWFSEVATAEECERARQFMLEFEPAPASELAAPTSRNLRATEPQGS